MYKIVFLICCVNVLLVVLTGCEFKSDYKKDAIDVSSFRQGRIAIIKQKSGHVREYIVENDSGYFREAPDCPKCQEEAMFKFIQDSVKKSIRFKQFIKEQKNEEGRTRETVDSESDQTDTIRH